MSLLSEGKTKELWDGEKCRDNLHASVSRGFTRSPTSTNVPIRINKREKERKTTAVCRSISTYFFGSSYYRIIELRFYARFFLQDVFKTALMSQNVSDIS